MIARPMILHTLLTCTLCGQPRALALNVFDDATLGAPRFFCRWCTHPGRFLRMLRAKFEETAVMGVHILDDWAEVVHAEA